MKITQPKQPASLALNASASGVSYDDSGGFFGGGTLTLQQILDAIGAGVSPDAFLTVIGGGKGTVQDVGAMGAAIALDLGNANYFVGELDDDTVITTIGWTAGKDCQITVELTEDGTGGWTPDFSGVTWIGGTPTWVTTAATVTIVVLLSRDGGTTIYGAVVGSGTGGGGDLDIILAASAGEDTADALLGANAPDSGNVFATMADVVGSSVVPRLVQIKRAGNMAASITLDAAPGNGHAVLLMCDGFTTGIPTAVSSTNTTWTQIVTFASAGAAFYALWVGVVSTSGGAVITVTHPNTFMSLAAVEITDALAGTAGVTATGQNAVAGIGLSGAGTGNLVVVGLGPDNTGSHQHMFCSNVSVGIRWGVVGLLATYATGGVVYGGSGNDGGAIAGGIIVAEIT